MMIKDKNLTDFKKVIYENLIKIIIDKLSFYQSSIQIILVNLS